MSPAEWVKIGQNGGYFVLLAVFLWQINGDVKRMLLELLKIQRERLGIERDRLAIERDREKRELKKEGEERAPETQRPASKRTG